MTTPAFEELETEFSRLSPDGQINLLEHLVRQARVAVASHPDNWDAEVCAAAAAPDIQRKLARIKAEFQDTESDGLV